MPSGATLQQLKQTTVSINMLSQMTGLDRATVTRYLDAEEIEPLERKERSTSYALLPALRGLIEASKGQSSADRRNDAQARKNEVETQILLGKYIPIEDVVGPIRSMFGAINRTIQSSKLSDDDKKTIVERLHGIGEELEIEATENGS